MDYIEACKILGVSPSDELNYIKKEYKSRIKFFHPDNFHGDEEKTKYAEKMTKKINEAWAYIEANYQDKEPNDKVQNETFNHIIYNYQYPVYERLYTKTITIILSVVFGLIACTGFAKFFKPIVEEIQLNKEFSDADIEAMQYYEFKEVYMGYELDTICSNISGKIIIPQTFAGEDVVCIADGAFADCSEISEVIIPNTVIKIGKSAFAKCTMIKTIKIPDNVSEITSVDFTSHGAFEDCDNLESVYIGDGITSLSYHTFSGCDNLKEIHLKSSIKEILPYSFFGCKNIDSVYYEGKIEEWQNIVIADTAFDNGTSFVIFCNDGVINYSN